MCGPWEIVDDDYDFWMYITNRANSPNKSNLR